MLIVYLIVNLLALLATFVIALLSISLGINFSWGSFFILWFVLTHLTMLLITVNKNKNG